MGAAEQLPVSAAASSSTGVLNEANVNSLLLASLEQFKDQPALVWGYTELHVQLDFHPHMQCARNKHYCDVTTWSWVNLVNPIYFPRFSLGISPSLVPSDSPLKMRRAWYILSCVWKDIYKYYVMYTSSKDTHCRNCDELSEDQC